MTNFEIGDTVKLLISTNPYVPVGSKLKIREIASSGKLLYVTAKNDNKKYFCCVEHVKLHIRAKEKVMFT